MKIILAPLLRISQGFDLFIFVLFLSLSVPSLTWATVGQVLPHQTDTSTPPAALPVCNICSDAITGAHFICPSGHTTCAECLSGHIGSELGNPQAIHAMNEDHLKCFEVTAVRPGAADRCNHPIPFEDIVDLINDAQRKTVLDIVLANATPVEAPKPRPHSPEESKSDSESDSEEDPRVDELRKKTEEAFIFSCPTCGGTGQEHDACCAVTCNNRTCQSYFCSLCYQKFGTLAAGGSTEAHKHVREKHLGNSVFEERHDEFDELDEGGHKIRWSYEKRYQWLITRRKLASVFTPEMDPKLKKALLHSIKKTYQGDYNLMMWPLPGALPVAEWVSAVQADKAMPPKKKIWFLQNEALHLREIKDTENATRVDNAVKELGGKVIAALDLQQAPKAAHPFVTAITPGDPDPEITAFRETFKREHPGLFAMGGEEGRLYRITDPTGQVPPFVLTDLAQDADGNPLKMDHKHALGWDDETGHHPGYCEARGGTLATKDQLEALSRAMRHGGRYNAQLIAGMQGTYFWSSSVHPDIAFHAFYFVGYDGSVDGSYRNSAVSVRCEL